MRWWWWLMARLQLQDETEFNDSKTIFLCICTLYSLPVLVSGGIYFSLHHKAILLDKSHQYCGLVALTTQKSVVSCLMFPPPSFWERPFRRRNGV